MKKNFLFGVILIISASLLSCKKETAVNNPEVTAASAVAQKHATVSERNMNVPFKGNFTASFQVLQGPPVINQIISGNGTATHLGNFSFASNVWVNATTPQPFQVNGTAIFTAANGDQFFTIVSGVSTPAGPDGIIATITHTITGGTGRFQNASGTLLAISTVGATATDVNINGQISF